MVFPITLSEGSNHIFLLSVSIELIIFKFSYSVFSISRNSFKLLEEFFIINPYIGTNTAVGATLILILFGAIAGYIPARRAAKIKPIIALRDE